MKKLIAAIAIISLLAAGAAMAKTVKAERHSQLVWTEEDPTLWVDTPIEKTDTGLNITFGDDGYEAFNLNVSGTWNLNVAAGDEVSLCYSLGDNFDRWAPSDFQSHSPNYATIFYDDNRSLVLNNLSVDYADGIMNVSYAFTPDAPISTVTGMTLYNYVYYDWFGGDTTYTISDPYFLAPGEDEVLPTKTVTDDNAVWTAKDPESWDGWEDVIYWYTDDDGNAVMGFTDTTSTGDNLIANGQWLVNANEGDEITVVYDTLGLKEGVLESRNRLPITLTYDDGKTLALTKADATIEDGKITFKKTLTEDMGIVTAMDVYGYFTGAMLDGSVLSLSGDDALLLTVPYITAPDRGTPGPDDPDDDLLVPEPATYAYGVLGLLSVIGMKRRIRK